jgi:hypothetical protein
MDSANASENCGFMAKPPDFLAYFLEGYNI